MAGERTPHKQAGPGGGTHLGSLVHRSVTPSAFTELRVDGLLNRYCSVTLREARVRQNLWLHRWIDELGISTTAAAAAAVKSPVHWGRLLELADGHDREPQLAALPKRSVSAGRSLDLTSFLACGHPDCVTGQVDRLFSRVWHYFDQIAVVGADAHRILELAESDRPESAQEMVTDLARVFMHARATGVERFLVFTDKPPACHVHWPEFHAEASLHIPDEALAPIAADLLQNGKISLVKGHCAKCGDRFLYQGRGLSNLRRSVPADWAFKRRSPGMTVEQAVVLSVLDDYTIGAASDLLASQELGAPLGLGLPFEARLLTALRPTATEEQIAFNINLPAMQGLGSRELIAIREQEGDAFEAFRVTLQQAMSVRLKQDGSGDPSAIAKDIENELLEPALVDLRRRLAAAEKTLQRKHIVHSAAAGLATVCGLLGESAAATTIVTAVTASAAQAEFSAIEKKTEVQTDNMYFLWKVDHQVKRKADAPRRKKRR